MENPLNTVGDLQFTVDLADIIAHRFGAEYQTLGNRRVGKSLHDEGEYLTLPLAQFGQRGGID